jgi:exodeoxyribonuclease VII large subunit
MVQGEVSNLVRAQSGHCYFSLKDPQGNIRCALFKQKGYQGVLTNGQQVMASAKIGIYQARGDFQLIVDHIQPAGDGHLKQQYEQLKQQLDQEGLFSPEAKKPLPYAPNTLGIITSSTGAALHDILTTLKRRCPQVDVIIYPSLVQGDQAKESLCLAIDAAEKHQQADLIIIARGGGSLEDLWPFNEACLAYRIASCSIPIISGVGHETDTTICDLVADQRAPTPTAAAEMAHPDQQHLIQSIDHTTHQLTQHMRTILTQKRQHHTLTLQRLQHPKDKTQYYQERLKDMREKLLLHMSSRLTIAKHQHIQAQQAHAHLSPINTIGQHQQQLSQHHRDLYAAIKTTTHQHQQALQHGLSALNHLNPQAILKRGYAIAKHQNKVITSAEDTKKGQKIAIQWHDGTITTTVD